MRLKTRWEGRTFDTKWLLYVPLYTSAVLGGLALAATLKAKGWDPWDWQGLIVALVVLFALIMLVMSPLLIVAAILKDLPDE